jgi:hypothetical protein
MNRRYGTMRASKTEGTSVPAIPLHVITLELKYLQIIAKVAQRDNPLHCFLGGWWSALVCSLLRNKLLDCLDTENIGSRPLWNIINSLPTDLMQCLRRLKSLSAQLWDLQSLQWFTYTRWFKYDRDKLWLVYTQIVPVIFEPPCICVYYMRVLSVSSVKYMEFSDSGSDKQWQQQWWCSRA